MFVFNADWFGLALASLGLTVPRMLTLGWGYGYGKSAYISIPAKEHRKPVPLCLGVLTYRSTNIVPFVKIQARVVPAEDYETAPIQLGKAAGK